MHGKFMAVGLGVATLGGVCSAAAGQDAPADEPAFGVNQGRLSFTLGADWVSSYFFRGYVQEDRGFIVQPHAEVGFELVRPDRPEGFGVTLSAGTWNSFHSEKTGSTGDGVESWYESDLYAQLSVACGRLSVGAGYTFYLYPNSDFSTVQELSLTAAYELDEGTLFGKALGTPSVGVFIETDNSNVSGDESVYLELAFGPAFEVLGGRATVSVPVTVGLSLDDYYDDAFGYVAVGVDVAIPLTSGEWGDASLTLGGRLLVLGDAARAANGGDDVDGYAYAGLSFTY